MPPKARNPALASRLIGYARVSTDEQGTDPQRDELRAAGCATILEEHASGADRTRPVLAGLLRDLRAGETLVVVRLDRLARSVGHLLAVIEQLEAAGAHFRSLRDPIDTSTPQGMFSLQVLGAVAQLERALIAERTKSGLKAARARPDRRQSGSAPRRPECHPKNAREPGCRASRRNPGTARFLAAHRAANAPEPALGDVVRVLNRGQATIPDHMRSGLWTVERLRRTVRRLANEGIVEASLLDRAKPQRSDDRLVRLVAGIKAAAPDRTLQQIAAQLEGMRERTPRGGTRWHPSSVQHLLARAERLGLAGNPAASVGPGSWR